jgi:hypothetical protein
MSCKTCNHEDHNAGKCKQCNCGESEVIKSEDTSFSLPSDYGDYLKNVREKWNELDNEKGDYKICR